MRTLVLSAIIAMTSVVNAVSGNRTNNFAYNTEVNGEHTVTQTVFKVENDKYLHNHLKYSYTYDNEGRVSAKEVLKWNEISAGFEKQYCLNFNYNGEETSIQYAIWNKEEMAYSNVKEKSVYQSSESTLHYQSYEWNKKENNWELIAEHNISQWNNALLADKTEL